MGNKKTFTIFKGFSVAKNCPRPEIAPFTHTCEKNLSVTATYQKLRKGLANFNLKQFSQKLGF